MEASPDEEGGVRWKDCPDLSEGDVVPGALVAFLYCPGTSPARLEFVGLVLGWFDAASRFRARVLSAHGIEHQPLVTDLVVHRLVLLEPGIPVDPRGAE